MRDIELGRAKNYIYLKHIWGVVAFVTISVIGLYYVKWEPYYEKALTAVAKHSIGESILAANSAAPPSPSWKAAADYAWAYFMAVWKAMILGLLLGSAFDALLPKAWLCRVLGGTHFKGVALAGLASIPAMM